MHTHTTYMSHEPSQTHMHMHTYTCTRTLPHMHTQTYKAKGLFFGLCILTHTNIHTHTHVHNRTQTHEHTNIHESRTHNHTVQHTTIQGRRTLLRPLHAHTQKHTDAQPHPHTCTHNHTGRKDSSSAICAIKCNGVSPPPPSTIAVGALTSPSPSCNDRSRSICITNKYVKRDLYPRQETSKGDWGAHGLSAAAYTPIR